MIHCQCTRHQNPILLTPTFIHAPGLGPDFKGIWFLLESSVYWRVLGQAWQGLGGGRWGSRIVEQGLGGVEGGVSVDAALTGHTVLGAALTVLALQLLLWWGGKREETWIEKKKKTPQPPKRLLDGLQELNKCEAGTGRQRNMNEWVKGQNDAQFSLPLRQDSFKTRIISAHSNAIFIFWLNYHSASPSQPIPSKQFNSLFQLQLSHFESLLNKICVVNPYIKM